MNGGPITGRVALVTGAATGIGRAIAERLAGDGASVVINHLDQDDVAAEVVRGIVAAGGRALAYSGDVALADTARRGFELAIAELGPVDVLVNNAAWAFTKPLVDVSEAELDRLWAVNVKGVVFACQEAARRMGTGGRIINLSSSTTGLSLPGYAAYDATKGAVEQLGRILARELGPAGITVNTVSPGATETGQFREGKSDEQIARLVAMSALGRLGRPDDIADVVAFLASDRARWITGQNIRVNGGTV